jgi:hypothetical protein
VGAAITALSWELVARYRWLYVVAAVWLLLVCALGLLLSALGWDPLVGVSLVLSLSGPLLFVLGGLAHGWDTHLENAGSCFPGRLFTLPVPTALLVGPPLLLGSTVLVLAWLLASLCMLRPFGTEGIPLWWPALCGAAVLAWIQAFTWFPFPLPWLRLGCFTVFLLGVTVGTTALLHHETSEPILAGLFLSLLVLAYSTALIGVGLARRGKGTHEPFQVGAIVVPGIEQTPPPFSSRLRAQLWLEWKVNGWVFFFVAGLCVVVTLPSMYFAQIGLQTTLPHLLPWIPDAREIVGDGWLVMSYMLLGPFLIALCGGSELGKAGLRYGDWVCPPFLATRAICTQEMIKAKLMASAVGVVCSWTILLVVGLAWAEARGLVGEMTDRLVSLTGSPGAAFGAFVGVQLLLVAIAWLWLISGLWLGALGRPRLTGVLAIIGMLSLSGMGWLIATWRDSWWPILDGAIIVCLIGKMIAVGCIVRQLLRERRVAPRTLSLLVIVWALFATLVIGLELRLLPVGARWVGITVLILPLARPLATPLALARNRTR